MAGKGKGYELKVQIGGEVESSFGKAFSKAERELATLYKFSRRTNQGFLDDFDPQGSREPRRQKCTIILASMPHLHASYYTSSTNRLSS